MRKIKIKRKESTDRVGSARSGAKSGLGYPAESKKLSPGGGQIQVIPTKLVKLQKDEMSSGRFKETKNAVISGSGEKQTPGKLKI